MAFKRTVDMHPGKAFAGMRQQRRTAGLADFLEVQMNLDMAFSWLVERRRHGESKEQLQTFLIFWCILHLKRFKNHLFWVTISNLFSSQGAAFCNKTCQWETHGEPETWSHQISKKKINNNKKKTQWEKQKFNKWKIVLKKVLTSCWWSCKCHRVFQVPLF